MMIRLDDDRAAKVERIRRAQGDKSATAAVWALIDEADRRVTEAVATVSAGENSKGGAK